MSPSDAAWHQLITALHASGRKAALAITGGGSGAIGELLRVPGGSRLRIDATGRVRALNDIPVSRRYADLFTENPEHCFPYDTSSSEIRARDV